MSNFIVDLTTAALKAGESEAKESGASTLQAVLQSAGAHTALFASFAEENPAEAAAATLAAIAVTAALAEPLALGATALAGTAAFDLIGTTITGAVAILPGVTAAAAEEIGATAVTATAEMIVDYYATEGVKALYGLGSQLVTAIGGSETDTAELSTSAIILSPSGVAQGDNFLMVLSGSNGTEGTTTWNFPDPTSTSPSLGIAYNGTGLVDLASGSWSGVTLTGGVAQIAYTDGTSAVATVNPDGSTTTQTFSGPGATGMLIGEVNNDPDGASLTVTGQILSNTGTAIGIELDQGGDVSNGTDLSGTEYGVWMPDGPGSVENSGTIIGTAADGVSIGETAQVTNSGFIGGAGGIAAGGAGTLENTGSITATINTAVSFGGGGTVMNGAGNAISGVSGGVVMSGGTGTVTNDGDIAASSGNAVELDAGGSVVNAAGATLAGGSYGVWMPDGPGSVDNDGTIIGSHADGISIGGAAALLNTGSIAGAGGIAAGGAGSLDNTGTITATANTAVSFGGGGSVSNAAGETIAGVSGGVVMSGAAGTVSNDGSILASSGNAVELDAGGSVVNAAGATLAGGSYGVWMPDGPGSVDNDGTIIGSHADGISIGGAAALLNTGSIAGAGGIAAGGAGSLDNTGTITATANTAVSFGGGGSVSNAAGETIAGVSGGVVMSGAAGTVSNDGSILASSGNAVELDAGGSVVNTAAGTLAGGSYGVWMPDGPGSADNDGTIIGTHADGISIGEAAALRNTGSIAGAGGIAAGGAGSLDNTGTITATANTAVSFGGGGSVSNAAGETIAGVSGGVVMSGAAGTVSNDGSILASSGNAVELDAGGSVVNTAAGTLAGGSYGVWMPDGPGSADNDGTIIGTHADGISIGEAAALRNTGSIAGAGGIAAGGAGSLDNTGTITATANTAVSFGGGGSVSNAAGETIAGVSGGVIMSGAAGTVSNDGSILASSGNAVELDAGGSVVNTAAGTLSGGSYGVWMPDGPGSVDNDGTIIGTHADGISIGGQAQIINTGVIAGATGIALGATGSTLTTTGTIIGTSGVAVALGSGDELVIGATARFVGSIALSGTADTVQVLGTSVPGTVIQGLGAGDQIVFPGRAISADSYSVAAGIGTLAVAFSDGSTGTLDLLGSYLPGNFTPQGDAIIVSCFARGTRILTTTGEIAVEDLAVGDLAMTIGSGANCTPVPRPIGWIGHRQVNIAAHPQPEQVRPIRIKAGAFGDTVPRRDLLLSPDHSVFVDGLLIPIKHLENRHSIAQEQAESIEYWHVELDRHGVLLGEGLPVESYLETGNRAAFANGGHAVSLHPDFARRAWQAACAELVEGGSRVVAVKRRLFERAGIAPEPRAVTLHAFADQREILPVELRPDFWRYDVAGTARSLLLASDTIIPAGRVSDSLDRRRLGVRVFGIAIDGCAIALDHPALFTGFHAIEMTAEGPCRWTAGAARIVLPPGARDVVLHAGDCLAPEHPAIRRASRAA